MSARVTHRALAVVLLLSALTGAAAERHLFLDPAFLREAKGVTLKVNPPARNEIVLRPDRPWEQLMISFYLSVLEEEGKLRMWYICRDAANRPNVAYAESRDGVNWVKPSLGVVEYEGSKENNLVGLSALEGAVYRDAKAPAAERYLYITHVLGEGMVRFFSPDGFHWQRDAKPFLALGADSQAIAYWDEAAQDYALYLRGWMKRADNKRYRTVVRADVPDFTTPMSIGPSEKSAYIWGRDKAPVIGDELPTVLATDESDAPNSDVYTISAQPYPLAPRWHLGFPSFFQREKTISQGRLEVQFIASRDGRTWQRYDRAPYAPLGLEGAENGDMTYIGPGLFVQGDEIWQYGTGFRTRHGDFEGRKQRTDGAIYRFVQRVDGFVCAEFGAETGGGVTAPVKVEGAQLLLNVEVSALGHLRVGLAEPGGQALAGFEPEACEVVRTNSTHAQVMWKGPADLTSLQGREVEVRFSGARAKLYSFRFE